MPAECNVLGSQVYVQGAEGAAERRAGATEVIFEAWTLRDGLGWARGMFATGVMQVSGLDFGEDER